MKSRFISRPSTVAFLLCVLAPALAHSQTRAQMDSLYAAFQREMLEVHPTALFPLLPYDKYVTDTMPDEYGTNGIKRTTQVPGEEFDRCRLVYPRFEIWHFESEETQQDPMKQVYVSLNFYMVDPETGVIMDVQGAKVFVRMDKTRPDEPDQYEDYLPESSGVFSTPYPLDEYSCAPNLECLSADDPLYALIKKQCDQYVKPKTKTKSKKKKR